MAFNFAQAKAQMRQTVHETLAVSALYQDDTMSDPAAITARYHNKIAQMGELDNGNNDGYALTIEGIDRVVFKAADARALSVKRGGELTFTDYTDGNGDPAVFVLQVKQPHHGPFEEVWEVSRK